MPQRGGFGACGAKPEREHKTGAWVCVMQVLERVRLKATTFGQDINVAPHSDSNGSGVGGRVTRLGGVQQVRTGLARLGGGNDLHGWAWWNRVGQQAAARIGGPH